MKIMISVLLFLWTYGSCCASEPLSLILKDTHGVQAGNIHDGYRIFRGILVNRDKHQGFTLWLDATGNKQPGHYILKGGGDGSHLLNVRFECPGLSCMTEMNRGVYYDTNKELAVFYIVADGDQTVNPDRYTISVQGKSAESKVMEPWVH